MANRSSYVYDDPTDYQQDYTAAQIDDALSRSGLSQQDQDRIAKAYTGNAEQNKTTQKATKKTTSPVKNPAWVYAVNMPSSYPDYAAMKAAGAGLVVSSDDPNAAKLIEGAKEWGIPVAVQVNAPPGITPEEYAARVAAAKLYAPDKLVLDIEQPGKGYGPSAASPQGDAGWQWSQKAGQLLKDVVGTTPVAVTMEPHQDDYNYAAYQGLGDGNTEFWVQSYTGDMKDVPTDWATGPANAAVGAGHVVTILGPGTAPADGTGNYVSYGIPQTGASAAGQYGRAFPGSPNNPSGQGPGGPGTPGVPPDVPTGDPPHPPPGSGSGTGGSKADDWTDAYFGSLGLPQDVQDRVAKFFSKYPDDPQLAIELAKQYIRTTPWFAQNFPGFFEGMRTGLFTDETGYRGYVNAVNVYTMQYFNRPVTTNEVQFSLAQGLTPEIVGRTYEAGAIARTQGDEIRYELQAFGETDISNLTREDPSRVPYDIGRQQAGLPSMQGARLQAAFERANKRMQNLFGGQLAIPNTAGQALAPATRMDVGA